MGNVFQFDWEIKLMSCLQNLICNSQLLVFLFYIITQLGSAVLIICIIAFLYLAYDKNMGRKIAINAIFASVFNSLIKNIFLRIRPYVINDSIECLFAVEPGYDIYDMSKQGYSFPSGHSTNISNIVISFYKYLKDKRIMIYGSLIIFLVCLSRIIIGVHYPSDVVAGVILGITSVLILDYLNERLSKKMLYLVVLGFSLLGLFYCDSNDYYSSLGLLIGFTMGDLFEEKYVRFKNTNNIKRMIIRTLFALGLFLGISFILKLLFSNLLFDSSDMLVYLSRVFRYMISSFVLIGIYPMVFKYNILRFNDGMEENDAD